MLTSSSKQDIEDISREILKQSKAIGIFPTPVDQIVRHTELVSNSAIDLEKVDRGFFEKLKDESVEKFRILQSGISKIKGFFDRREKTIYIDLNLLGGRQNFVKLHEVGHAVLPWQNEVMLASDNDETLIYSFEDEFESEANYFASVTLFQHDLFFAEMSKLPLGLASSMELAKKFGSSVHSALRNYVIQSNKRCALIVLTPIEGSRGNGAICDSRDVFYSKPFIENIGELKLPSSFGFKWAFIQDYKFKKKYNDKGTIQLVSMSGEEVEAVYHFFNNTYNSFVFLFPKGEVNKVRTQIIIAN